MTLVLSFFRDFFYETVRVLYESGLFVLFGFFMAGILQNYLSTDKIARYLGGRDFRSVLNAALLGAPLPLCSCGVVPAAVTLRRKGASRESVLSFLVSTPETSVESIALTYGLLGPVFAVVRPVAALFSAAVAGIAHMIFGSGKEEESFLPEESTPSCADDCDAGTAGTAGKGNTAAVVEKSRFRSAVDYAFVTLFDDLVFWFLIGVLLTGLIAAVLPDGFLARYIGGGLLSMILAMLVGIPLYMCASGSTPVAAAFLMKGLNPGAALVFLLTGPATNAATLTILGRTFGRRFLQVFLVSVIGSALIAGLALNRFYTWSTDHAPATSAGAGGFLLSAAKGLGFIVFLYLAWRSLRRTGIRPGFAELREHLRVIFSPVRRFRPAHLYRTWRGRVAVAVLLLAWLLSGFYTVAPGEVGMERDFGVIAATDVPPGLHWCFPWPVGKVTRCSMDGVIRLDIGFRSGEKAADPITFYAGVGEEEAAIGRMLDESIYITGDENLLDLVASVHYRVADPTLFTFGVESGESVVRSAALSAFLREVVYRPIDRIYTTDRRDIEFRVRSRANKTLERTRSGLSIESVCLLDTHAPREVHYDFRDVASSKEDRSRMIHEAHVYRQGTVNEARGTASKIVSEAMGARTRTVADASGAAVRFRLMEEAARGEPGGTRTRLYLESMERILPGCRTVIRPDPLSVRDFELWFRSGEGTAFSDLFGEMKGEKR